MQPLVKQHLESLRKTLMDVIVPELGKNSFVAEQAGLIAASLALLAEVQPYQDDYLRVELADLRKALAILGAPADLRVPAGRDALVEAVTDAKAALSARIAESAQANGGTLPPDQRTALAPLLDRQMARECSWSRLTGFNPAGASLPAIGELLEQQRSAT
ncbi:MAG: hypothetical protein EPN72_13385 [Nevskiaceae bacterium]|nr:MAG: hypothetical protein EPN63_13715 [Nevskiaceae bacterium]TBR71464.1 MAG: hypothetical protein EPN72_13385 [Nevskiaceae bacterium]